MTSSRSESIGVVWLDIDQPKNAANLWMVHTIMNSTDIVISSNFTEIMIFPSKTNSLTYSNVAFNSSEMLLTNLSRSSLVITIRSSQFPDGEIGGYFKSVSIEVASSLLKPITWKTWVALTILCVMMMLLISNLMEPEIILFGAMMMCVLTQIITVENVRTGFVNEGLLVVMLLIVAVEPLAGTPLFAKIISFLLGSNGKWPRLSMLRMMLVTGITSSFVSTSALMSLFLEAIREWCRENNFPAGKFVMPMLFSTTAGGMFTIIGSSSTLVLMNLLERYNFEKMGFFEPFYVAGPCFVLITIFILTLGYWMLPSSEGLFTVIRNEGRNFLTELVIPKESGLIGKPINEVLSILNFDNMRLVEIIRQRFHEKINDGKDEDHSSQMDDDVIHIIPVKENTEVFVGDRLIFAGEVKDILEILKSKELNGMVEYNTGFDPNEMIGMMKLQPPKIQRPKSESPSKTDETTSTTPPLLTHVATEPAIDTVVDIPDVTKSNSLDTSRIVPHSKGQHSRTTTFNVVPRIAVESERRRNPIYLQRTLSGLNEEISPKVTRTGRKVFYQERNVRLFPKNTKKKDEANSCPSKFTKLFSVKSKAKRDDYLNDPEFFEIILSHENPFVGSRLADCDFQIRYEVSVLALRRQGNFVSTKLGDVKLEGGDTLLVLGKGIFFQNFSKTKDFYLILRCNVPTQEETEKIVKIFGKSFNLWWYQYLAFPIFIIMIIIATIGNFVDIGASFLMIVSIGVFLYVVLGLMTTEQVFKKLPVNLWIIVGSSIAVGNAVVESGLSTAIGLLIASIGMPSWLIPGVLFFIIGLTTQFIHNVACASIFFPVALGITSVLNLNMLPFAHVINIASNISFATPFGTDGNLLIKNAYKFWQFVLLGTPVCLIYWIVTSVLAPIIWKVE